MELEEINKLSKQEFAELISENILGGTSISNVMHLIDLRMKEIQHYKDTTLGLWATDRPDLIDDPQKIMFQLTDNK